MEKPVRAALIGALAAALATLPGLPVGTLWDNSETAYGEVAREILLSHDWVVMHLNGAPWFIQPPLYFWIAALFAKAFGVGTLALRLPSALATIAMGAMTGYAVTRQAGTRAGVIASLVLSTCLMQAIVGRLAIMDALLDLAVALTIFWWFRALQTGRSSYFAFGCIAAAFGFLAKGPVAPVICALVIVPYWLWNLRHEPTPMPSLRGWLIGGAAFVLVVAPWLLALSAHGGPHGVMELIGHYTIGRYTGVIENQSGPLWYYVPVVLLGFFPWSAFLPMSIVYAFTALRGTGDPTTFRLLRLGVVWAVVPFVFFTFARTKLPNYIALEFPAFALLVGLYFDALAKSARRRGAILSALAVPVTIVFVAIAVQLFSRDNHVAAALPTFLPALIAAGLVLAIGSVVCAVLLARRDTLDYAPYPLAIAAFLALDALIVLGLPQADNFKPVPPLAATIQSERHASDTVAIEGMPGGNALLFYTMPPVDVIAQPDDRERSARDARSIICGAQRVWLVASRDREHTDPTFGRNRRIVQTSGKAALYLYDGPACR